MKYKIAFDDEAEFQLSRGAVSSARAAVFAKWRAAFEAKGDPDEIAFYAREVRACDKLIAKYEAVLISDKSQDAEPDEEEDECES